MARKQTPTIRKEELYSLYVEKVMNTRQIAGQLGVSPRTVARKLHLFGIQARPQGAAPHTILRDRRWLRTQYCVLGKSTVQIAKYIGATPRIVLTWIDRFGIERRPRNQHRGRKWSVGVRKNMSDAKKGRMLGKENPNWKGGTHRAYKRFRNSYAARAWSIAVRTRDGHKCKECGKSGRLHAHHIKPFRSHVKLRYDVSNGVTLCPSCHEIIHGRKFPEWVHTPSKDEIPTSAGDADRR